MLYTRLCATLIYAYTFMQIAQLKKKSFPHARTLLVFILLFFSCFFKLHASLSHFIGETTLPHVNQTTCTTTIITTTITTAY